MFKVFQVSTQNLEKNSKNNVYRIISFAFKFEFVTFKPNLKWENTWNKSCRFRHFEQLLYSKFFEFQLKILILNRVKIVDQSTLSLSPSSSLRWRRARRALECSAARAGRRRKGGERVDFDFSPIYQWKLGKVWKQKLFKIQNPTTFVSGTLSFEASFES